MTRRAREELLLAGLPLPLAVTQLDTILECFDADTGGHGRTYARYLEETIAELARWSMVYVGLALEHGIAVDENEKCPLYCVSLPESTWWHEVPRPGGRSQITLEEAEACVWALGARLERSEGGRQRLVLAGDNAAQIGAFQRGRSSSARINAKSRRAASIVLGSHSSWVSTKKNTADRPSRVYGGTEDPRQARRQPQPAAEVAVEGPQGWADAPSLAVMICAGGRRRSDWAEHLSWEARRHGVGLQILTLDTSDEGCGLLLEESWAALRRAAVEG